MWLKNPQNWTAHQRERFHSLKLDTLKVGRAWAIKEAFADFWDYHYAASARKFFYRWYFWATHSRLAPIANAAKTLKRHLPGLLGYTKHRITNAVAQATNATIQLTKANARATATSRSTASRSSFTAGSSTSTQRAVHTDPSSAYPHEIRKTAFFIGGCVSFPGRAIGASDVAVENCPSNGVVERRQFAPATINLSFWLKST